MKKEWDKAYKKLAKYGEENHCHVQLEARVNRYEHHTHETGETQYVAYVEKGLVHFAHEDTAMKAVDEVIRQNKENKEKEDE
jgi:hypothetical protein